MMRYHKASKYSPFTYLLFFSCCLLQSLFCGCVDKKKMNNRITDSFSQTAINKPYINETILNSSKNLVFNAFYERLLSSGVQILSLDTKAGVICWCDTSSNFVPLPTNVKKMNLPGYDFSNAAGWQGYVYGSTLIREMENGTWITINTTGLDYKTKMRIYSDGTYESKLLSSLKISIDRIAIGTNKTPDAPKIDYFNSQIKANSYKEVIDSRYRKAPSVSISDMKSKCPAIMYPVSQEQLWQALLDVTIQYGIICSIDSNLKRLSFSHRMTVPVGKDSAEFQSLDVFMAVHVEKDSEESCKIYTVLLDKDTLKPRMINLKTAQDSNSQFSEISDNPLDTAAASIIQDLDRLVQTQLFYNEKWGNKLLRRIEAY